MDSREMLNISLIGIGIAANANAIAVPVSNANTNASANANVMVVEDKVEEEAKDVRARQHSGIRLSVINKVNNDSTEEDDNKERNKTDYETTNGNKEVSIGGSGFSVLSPNNTCKGGIDSAIGGGLLVNSQSSSEPVDEDNNDNDSTSGIHGLNNDDKMLIEEESENAIISNCRQ
jgi:hypothetical protein